MRVRQALNYAINRDEINKIVAVGLGQPSSAILPKEHWACDPATQNYYTYDPDKAKKLLAEAGHPNGARDRSLSAGPTSSPCSGRNSIIVAARQGRHPRQADAARAAAGDAGLHDREEGRDAHQPVVGLSGSEPVSTRRCSARRRCAIAGGIELPGFRELLDATMAAQDQAARKAASSSCSGFVVEQALQLVQYISPAVAVANKKVMNYQDSLLAVPKFTDVWLQA